MNTEKNQSLLQKINWRFITTKSWTLQRCFTIQRKKQRGCFWHKTSWIPFIQPTSIMWMIPINYWGKWFRLLLRSVLQTARHETVTLQRLFRWLIATGKKLFSKVKTRHIDHQQKMNRRWKLWISQFKNPINILWSIIELFSTVFIVFLSKISIAKWLIFSLFLFSSFLVAIFAELKSISCVFWGVFSLTFVISLWFYLCKLWTAT